MGYISRTIYFFCFGNVIPEAMASGLCTVSFRLAAAAELVRDGINGVVIAPGDDAAFVQATVDLMHDGMRRCAMARRASTSVQHLDWDQVIDGFVGTLRDVISSQEGLALVPGGLLMQGP